MNEMFRFDSSLRDLDLTSFSDILLTNFNEIFSGDNTYNGPNQSEITLKRSNWINHYATLDGTYPLLNWES